MKSSTIFFKSLKRSFYYLKELGREHPTFILSFYLTLTGLSMLAHYLGELSSRNLLLTFLLPLFIQCFCVLTVGFLAVFAVPYLLQNHLNKKESGKHLPLEKNFALFLKKHFNPWKREMAKSLAMSYVFALLLIVPGMVRFFRYSFVSHIVFFNPSYGKEKKFSALKHSVKMSRGFVKWFFLFLSSYAGLSYFLMKGLSLWQSENFWLLSLTVTAADYLLILFYGLLWGLIYHQIYLEKEEQTAAPPAVEEPPRPQAAV